MSEATDLDHFMKEMPGNKPIVLANETCIYCGIPLAASNSSKEHVIGRRFVPKGKFDGQWNLIVQACKKCNGNKADLENDISAITMHANAWGKHSIDDEALAQEAKRKAANSISRRTGKTVSESSETFKIDIPLGPGIKFTFDLSTHPQIQDDRVFELARLQLSGFFYWITYDLKTRRGGFWIGYFFPLLQTPRADWGNRLHRSFMESVVAWEPRVLASTADGYFKIAIRRHPTAVCWSWALEWNHNYRVIGFFGEEMPVRDFTANFPTLRTNSIIEGPNEYVRYRTEERLHEKDDCLFVWNKIEESANDIE